MLNALEGTPHHERAFELHEMVQKDDFEALSQDHRWQVAIGYVREPCRMRSVKYGNHEKSGEELWS